MLIPTQQALDMLATVAPRPWCKRLLCWEIFQGPLNLYALKGEIVRFRPARDVLEEAGFSKAPTEDELEALKASEEPDFYLPVIRAAAAKWVAEPIETTRHEWEAQTDIPLPFGLIPISTIDWERGLLTVDLTSGLVPDEWFEDDDDFALDDYETLTASFSELSFELAAIEMLAPSASTPDAASSPSRAAHKRLGRPPKWDWEAALAHVAQVANTPDGLPSGDGAQAQVERLISTYFVDHYGAEPAASEVRRRASMT